MAPGDHCRGTLRDEPGPGSATRAPQIGSRLSRWSGRRMPETASFQHRTHARRRLAVHYERPASSVFSFSARCVVGVSVAPRRESRLAVMTPRERILRTLARQPVDRTPVDLWHTPEVAAMLRRHFQVDDDLAVYRALGLDKIVWVFLDYKAGDQRSGSQSGAGAESGAERTTWGVPLRNIQAGEANYAEFGEAPLTDYATAESLADYPWWPKPENFDYDSAVALAQKAAQEFAVIGPWVSFFEIYCQMRGLEQAMMDLIDDPDYVDAVLDRIEAIQTAMMREFFARARGSVDLVFISDDIAGQQTLLISPRQWERHLQPRLRRWCDLVHAHGLKVFYHTDGAARPLLRAIIDCGVDVLNPIQHACPGMDMAELKAEFGERVIFHGGVDNQTVLPRGNAEMVRAEVLDCIRTLGAGDQGYICCSCHNTQAGTPLANILALVETARAFSHSSSP
ncbi:MAG: hypothetical protein C0518_01865 [Opitutus sp.]|nr:hypothetical protein [Opitutus sp.]